MFVGKIIVVFFIFWRRTYKFNMDEIVYIYFYILLRIINLSKVDNKNWSANTECF